MVLQGGGKSCMLPETIERLKQADYDLGTAEAMWQTGRYVYTAFMCQLAVEKALKALVVERTGDTPPKTHNLLALAKLAQPALTPEHVEFLAVLNMAGVGTRYPDLLDEAIKRYPKELARDYLVKAREVIQCLKDQTSSLR